MLSYTPGMKTAVSIPDPVFKAADRFARKRGLSRSALYAEALNEFLRRHNDDEITKRLDAVYATESSTLDPVLEAAQARTLRRVAWKK